jgi:predicted negative regulator of RcsB-dependent stress response
MLPNPYLILGAIALVGGLTGWAIWERHEAQVAIEGREVAERQAAISAADAQRWQAASGDRDAALLQCNTDKAEYTARTREAAAAKTRADQAAAAAIADAEVARAAADARISEILEEANAHPESVRDLGPIVRARVDSLWQ